MQDYQDNATVLPQLRANCFKQRAADSSSGRHTTATTTKTNHDFILSFVRAQVPFQKRQKKIARNRLVCWETV